MRRGWLWCWGAVRLASGTKELRTGANELSKGSGELKDGISELKDTSYTTFFGKEKDMDGSVKFIIETAPIEARNE